MGPIPDAPIPGDVIERAVCIVLDHVVPRLEYPSSAEAGKVRDVTLAALTASGLPARVAELEAALDCLMRAAKAWLEPSGSYANPAMHQARAALNAKGAPDAG